MATKRFVVLVLLFTCLGLVLGSLNIETARADTFTRTFSSLSYDGTIYSQALIYSEAQEAPSGSIYNGLYVNVGQLIEEEFYTVHRAFLFFDTSIIPNNAHIISAELSLCIYKNYSSTDFNVTITNGQPQYPHAPLEAGDFSNGNYIGNGGSRNTSTITSLNYWNVTLSATGLTWINMGGTTKLCLRSSRDAAPEEPTGDEYIRFYGCESGVDYASKLYVTYEFEGYHYIVHGPYYENGNVYANTVNVTLYKQNEAPYKFVLDGADGADTINVTTEQRGWYFAWNISSIGYNKTRIYYLTSASFEELWIYIPNPDEPFELYSFTVTDFAGITNGYLESRINVAGQNRIIERQRLGVVGAVPFWMMWANRYDMHLTCDQGGYTWGGFVALTETSQSLIITADMFPPSYPGMDVTVNALRMNATWIQINYTDHQLQTSWVQITIKYREGTTWKTAYGPVTITDNPNTQKVDWKYATATTDYVVTVTASRESQLSTWTFSCPKPAVTTNPWEGLFEVLGTWPIPASNVFGLAIVLCVFGVFSYASLEVGCVLGVLMAMFLTAIGWLQISWTLLAFALVIAIFAAIQRGKSREREI